MMIKITSHKNLETVCCSLPLIAGEVSGVCDGEVELKCSSKETIFWPIVRGKFKILVSLIPGQNNIVLKVNSFVKELSLTYEPQTFKRFVRLVYITCCDEDGTFQAPPNENSSTSSACARIALGAQMLQTFTGAKLNAHELEFKTYKLEEVDGQPVCHIFKSSLSLQEALKLSENELWEHFALELMKSDLRVAYDCKFLAFLSFTRYVNSTADVPKSFKEVKAMTQGYVALATGGLALLGSACLHTWPQTLSEVPWRFGDSRRIDKMDFMDDSGNRGTHWGCYATTLGATMHELGHVFNLGHTSEGIMSRGFDNIHKFFIVDLFYCSHPFQKKRNPYYQKSLHERENLVSFEDRSGFSWSSDRQKTKAAAPLSRLKIKNTIQMKGRSQSAASGKPPWRLPDLVKADFRSTVAIDGSFWARSSALILYYHKWFNNYGDEEDVEKGISGQGTTFHSSRGLRIMEFRDEAGTAFHHLEFLDGEGITRIDIAEVPNIKKHLSKTSGVTVHAQDNRGNICLHTVTL